MIRFVYNVFSLFPYPRKSPLFLQRELVLYYEVQHVALPCFYSSPEQTNQTAALGTVYTAQVFTSNETLLLWFGLPFT